MDDFLSRALDLAAVKGASYCDVRLVETNQERFVVRTGVVDTLSNDESLGVGVRVLVNGSWGFASTNIVTAAEVDRVTDLAVEIAKASAQASSGPISLGAPVKSQGVYTTPVQVNPFTVSSEEKLGLLLVADERMGSVKGISARTGNLIFSSERKTFANSEGAHVEQTIYETGGGIMATARGSGEVQRRSYPQSMRQQGCAGWEFVENMDLAGNAERTATEAVALLSADQCPSGTTTLIVGASQLGLQIHESCGHAIELDRVLGSEAAYAGTSFLTTEKLHNFQYGSEHVNITADSTRLPGLG
ncbi:MAG: TldD/PmbA family protein, partial [Dehalococcoidia bacterium]|nr:TldD/PmbA family protein [Dehalococcoidia bacterium]